MVTFGITQGGKALYLFTAAPLARAVETQIILQTYDEIMQGEMKEMLLC